MTALTPILYSERMVGADSPSYDDTLNRMLLQVVDLSGADDAAFVGFALRPAVAPSVGQFYRATDTVVGASWQTLVASMVSDLASAATGITKVGTIDTGVWQGTSIATTYTDAKVKSVTGTSNRLTIGGTASDPVFDISSSYVGQSTITTLGTIVSGAWNGTSISTTYTDAKVASITGTSNRLTVAGTASVPVLDIALTYVGQATITTLGTIATGVWQGTQIADTYLAALSASKLTGTTLPANIVSSSLTALGTVVTGVWTGTSIGTTYTDAKVASVAGTSNRITIGGTATAPTVDIASAYVGQATITTLGTVATGTWAASTITVDKGGTNLTSFTAGDLLYASGTTTLSKLGVGSVGRFLQVAVSGVAPQWNTIATADISDLTSASTGITKVGTIATGVWNGTAIVGTYGGTGVNNGASTITLGGSLVFSGAFTTTITVTAGTAVTLPTSGTLLSSTVTSLPSLVAVGVLASPHMTGAVVDSGGFTVTSGTTAVAALTATTIAGTTITGTTAGIFGTSPATAGALRLPNDTAGAINFRNAAGNGNIAAVYLDAFDGLILGTGAAITYFPGTVTMHGTVNIDNGTLVCGTIQGGELGGLPKITAGVAPANASSSGTQGWFVWDSGFLYICTATNTWKRVAVATWP